MGREIAERLERAGFTGVRSESLALTPPPVVAVLGTPSLAPMR
jgi:hypothetical protein